jgi:hypothetical protein
MWTCINFQKWCLVFPVGIWVCIICSIWRYSSVRVLRLFSSGGSIDPGKKEKKSLGLIQTITCTVLSDNLPTEIDLVVAEACLQLSLYLNYSDWCFMENWSGSYRSFLSVVMLAVMIVTDSFLHFFCKILNGLGFCQTLLRVLFLFQCYSSSSYLYNYYFIKTCFISNLPELAWD